MSPMLIIIFVPGVAKEALQLLKVVNSRAEAFEKTFPDP